ncbi:MAG: DUF624 domain-containing protein [Clostridia bacterium]|nr:DUF624 domain-containing protein [Clostridia bacterium]
MSKNKWFKLTNFDKPGRGVTKEEAEKNRVKRYSLGGFFKLTWRNLALFAMLNLIFLLTNVFIMAALIALTGHYDTFHVVPAATTFQPLFGIASYGTSAQGISLWGISGTLNTVGYPGVVTYVLYGIAALCIFTFGPTSAGLAYVCRGVARGDYVDLSDYFRTIKKNFGQSLVMGILDILVAVVFGYAVYFYFLQTAGGFMYQAMYFLSLFFFLIYLMMRSFFYLLIVTFKLSLWKVIKNSYILTIAGIRRNITALIGGGLLIGFNVVLFIIFPPLGAILPFFLLVSLLAFMGTFAAYPTVKRLMIDPYYPEETAEPEEEEEPVFRDMG